MENTIRISGREKQVLRMLLSEKKGHEIAKYLGIDEKTVCTYKLRLLRKTNSKTIIGLYLWNKVNKIVEVEEQKFEKSIVKITKSNLEENPPKNVMNFTHFESSRSALIEYVGVWTDEAEIEFGN